MTAERPRLLLLIGVGRSGTSAFVGIVRELGYRVPQPEVVADETNPRGFGEPRWVVDFHTRLLKERRVTTIDSRPAAWDLTAAAAVDDAVVAELRSWLEVQLVGTDRIVVKDPRISWFLPLWRRCADELGVDTGFVTMLRPPTEVLGSAKEWYGARQNDASRAAGWANIMLRTEEQSRGLPRAFVRYDVLLADWAAQVQRVGGHLDDPELQQLDPVRRTAVDAFIDPQLRRQTRGWDDLDVPGEMRGLVDRAWEALVPLGDDIAGMEGALDEVRADYDRLYADSEAIAQSSIRAAKPRRKPAAQEAKPATSTAKKAAKKAAKPAPAPPPGLVRRVRRRLRRVLRGGRSR
jgi:hypothetical protein